jgi:seryl-tRNA synthetase
VLTLKKAGTTGGTQQSQQQGENVMTQVKISEETLKALGATAGDVEDKIKALIAANAKAQTDLDAAQASASEFTVKIEAIEGRLKAVEARKLEVSAEDRTAIVAAATAEAKKAASSEVSAAIAKVGVNAVSAGAGDDTTAKLTFPQIVAAKETAGVSKADAIRASIKSNPKEYQEWRKQGGETL